MRFSKKGVIFLLSSLSALSAFGEEPKVGAEGESNIEESDRAIGVMVDEYTPRSLSELIKDFPIDHFSLSNDEVRKPIIFGGYKRGMSIDESPTQISPISWNNMTNALKAGAKGWWNTTSPVPTNLLRSFRQADYLRRLEYNYIIAHPDCGVIAAWDLPKPIEVKDIEATAPSYRFSEEIKADETPFVPPFTFEPRKTHWLHVADAAIQLSQAYLSPNWYQGGNNSFSMLIGLLWNVKLNEVYHPNLMFENNVSYKLALNTTPQDTHHKYSFSEDLFQWNMKGGLRAFSKKWFYTFTLQFKTQFFPNYMQNSDTRSAAFLSPGELNLGLGMSYMHTNAAKTLKFSVSISPISYNLKSCIDNAIDHTQYSIPVDKKFVSEVGSSAEATMLWNIMPNISWTSRLFLFTDYTYGMGDWENTLSFNINRFLSTQIYVHLRYDSSSALSEKWKHWMLKEILSFGFSYHFSTKI